MATDNPVPDPADAPARPDVEGADAPGAEMIESADDLRRDWDDYRDRWMRKTAEFDNYRRRIERERREHADESVVRMLEDLLLVVDDFERALSVEAGQDAAAYRKGVEMIYGKLQDLLRKCHVTPVDALGADFDPNVHQAVMHEVSPDHREGEVIGELRRGYRIGDRLLRPAMVKVAKA